MGYLCENLIQHNINEMCRIGKSFSGDMLIIKSMKLLSSWQILKESKVTKNLILVTLFSRWNEAEILLSELSLCWSKEELGDFCLSFFCSRDMAP